MSLKTSLLHIEEVEYMNRQRKLNSFLLDVIKYVSTYIDFFIINFTKITLKLLKKIIFKRLLSLQRK